MRTVDRVVLLAGIVIAIGVWIYALNLLACHLIAHGSIIVYATGLAGCLVIGGLAWLLMYLSQDELDIKPRKPAFLATGATWIVVLLNALPFLAGIAELKLNARAVVEVGLKRFEWLDKDGNGWITEHELRLGLSSLSVPDSEKHLIDHILRNMHEIGARLVVVGAHSGGSIKQEVGLLPGEPVYVIRKSDLQSYQKRLAQRYGQQ